MTTIHVAAFIQIENKKILVTKTKGNSVWFIPGGKIQLHESTTTALCREILEELGVMLLKETLKLDSVIRAPTHDNTPETIVEMECFTGSFVGTPSPSGEIEHIDYFSYSQRDRVAIIDQILFDNLKKESRLE